MRGFLTLAGLYCLAVTILAVYAASVMVPALR